MVKRDTDRPGACQLNQDGIGLEGAPREDHFIPGVAQSGDDLLEDANAPRSHRDLPGRDAEVAGDPFAEFDVELGTPAESISAITAPMLTVPPPLEVAKSPLDHVAWPVKSTETDEAMASAVTAHFASDAAPEVESRKPVWLLGTIEPLDDTTAPSVVPIEVRRAVGAERLQR